MVKSLPHSCISLLQVLLAGLSHRQIIGIPRYWCVVGLEPPLGCSTNCPTQSIDKALTLVSNPTYTASIYIYSRISG
jgi:hypothetical protein